MDPETLGLGLTVANLVNQVMMGGITCGISRFYSIAAEKHDLHSSARLLRYSTAVVFIAACSLLFGLHLLGHSQWMILVTVALILCVLSGYNLSLNYILNAGSKAHLGAVPC